MISKDVISQSDIDRFWSYVDVQEPDNCWVWLKWTDPYGRFHIGKERTLAHIFSYELKNGFGSAMGLVIRHSCDNPPCVNPAHLIGGTHKENTEDMYCRGRQGDWKGSKHGLAKLTEDDVRTIKELIMNGSIQRRIAEQFGVSYATITLIKRGINWKHMEGSTKDVKNLNPFRSRLTETDVEVLRRWFGAESV